MNKTGKSILQLITQDEENARALGLIPDKSIFTKTGFEACMRYNKENRKLLESCKCHSFTIQLKDEIRPYKTVWECANCGGEVSESDKTWYELGLLHGQMIKGD